MAAIREFGGHFLEIKDGLHFDIGDKRAWDKTSQALREGQTEVRARLEEDEARHKGSLSSAETVPAGVSRVAQYKEIISDQGFLEYSKRVLESLYNPHSGVAADLPTTEATPGANVPEPVQRACGPNCLHAQRRQTLNKASADLFAIHQSMRFQQTSPMRHQPITAMQQHQTFMPAPQHFHAHMSPGNGHMPHGTAYVPEITPTQGTNDYCHISQDRVEAMDPLPFNAQTWQSSQQYHGNFDPNTVNMQPSSNGTGVSVNSAKNTYFRGNMDSLEPLPYDRPGVGMASPSERPNVLTRYTSVDTIISLRDILGCVDFEVGSKEGRLSVDTMLSREIDGLIRSQSDALQYIDTFQAFEDLIFEEDSVNFHDVNPSVRGRISDLTSKDDMSLMNMSFLTIDDKEDDGKDRTERNIQRLASYSGQSRKYYSEGELPNEIRRDSTSSKITRCSNISMMSMGDAGSFRDLNLGSISDLLVEDVIADTNDSEKLEHTSEKVADTKGKSARRLGFPIRKTVIGKYAAGLPSVIGQSEPYEKVSSFTISEGSVIGSDRRFTEMAARVADTDPDKAHSSLSEINVSQMSMSSDL